MGTIFNDPHMWVVLLAIMATIVAYAIDRIPLEVTSVGTLAFLLLLFQVWPLTDDAGVNLLPARRLLAGIADPALIALLALLVIGQAMVRTGAFDGTVRRLAVLRRHRPFLTLAAALLIVAVVSGFLNNTPVVLVFIPIFGALAERMNQPASSLMMPLSFVAIAGGMTTLIGSSTNLLVSSALAGLDLPPLTFFEFTLPGVILAAVGFLYALFVAPRLLPERASYTGELVEPGGKHFVAQLTVDPDSSLIGEHTVAGMIPSLPNATVRMVQRGERALLPPLDEIILQANDVIVLSATRNTLTDVINEHPNDFSDASTGTISDQQTGDQVLAEVVVAPASRIIGRNLRQIVFHHRTNCVVMGIQRRSHMIRARMTDIRLEAGDVLLLFGHRNDILALRNNPDVLLMEWSARELPARRYALRATVIFLIVVLAAASDLVPIVVAAVAGAAAMIMTGCLNVHQASRAVDRRILLLVWAALALAAALEATGGAATLAHGLIGLLTGAPPAVIVSAFFLLVAIFTNVLSNNATAVLFTPIAINIAQELRVDPSAFIFATIFAANCSFATPMGYQTNLLVMGPGHYRFSDFVRAGTPLIILIWLSYSLFTVWYYPLW